jgi:hypothetical protein
MESCTTSEKGREEGDISINRRVAGRRFCVRGIFTGPSIGKSDETLERK